ncbi:ATP-dependent Clp protease ATP-binding subunit ClpX [Bienertia sinuspersici]
MYAIERYLQEMESDVRNKGCPERSMSEGYSAKECSRFCGRHVMRSHITPNNFVDSQTSQSFLPKVVHPIKGKGKTRKKDYGFMIDELTWAEAHQYVLFNYNYEEVERYIT